MKLPVTCSGPCEVHADVIGNETDGGVRLAHGGRGSIGLFADPDDPFAPRRLGAVRLRVIYGAPDARHPRTRTVTLRLRRTPSPPAAHPVSLRRRLCRKSLVRRHADPAHRRHPLRDAADQTHPEPGRRRTHHRRCALTRCPSGRGPWCRDRDRRRRVERLDMERLASVAIAVVVFVAALHAVA
jgi:hypothetical protein